MAKALRCPRERPVRLCPADNGGVRDFEFQDFSNNNAWKSCNGHRNNVMWSTYCDNDTSNIVTAQSLGPGDTGGGGGVGSATNYWHFHTHHSNQASNDFEFYFR